MSQKIWLWPSGGFFASGNTGLYVSGPGVMLMAVLLSENTSGLLSFPSSHFLLFLVFFPRDCHFTWHIPRGEARRWACSKVQRKPLQYCKVIRLQLIKINEKKKFKSHFSHYVISPNYKLELIIHIWKGFCYNLR